MKKPHRGGARSDTRSGDSALLVLLLVLLLGSALLVGGHHRCGHDFFFHLRHGGRHDGRVQRATAHGLDALGQLQVADVQALVLGQAREVDGHELGQLGSQALDLELDGDAVDQALVGLHGRRGFFAREVQRHLLAQARGLVDALEVHVHDHGLVGVHLEVAQQHLVRLAGQVHLEDGRVEGFLLQREEQGVVIEFDHGRRAGTVDDAGHLGGVAQAAARSGPLLRTRISGEFHSGSKDGWAHPRPGGPMTSLPRRIAPQALAKIRSCCSAPRRGTSPIRRRRCDGCSRQTGRPRSAAGSSGRPGRRPTAGWCW